MENLTVVSEVFWPCILGIISTVSNLFSNGKSNRCFNNFLALDFRESIHGFNFFFQMKNLTVVSNIFLAVHFSQAIHSLNLVFKWKFNRCFNNFLALDFRESMNSFHFFFPMKNLTVVSTFFLPCILAKLSIVSILFSNGKSNRCFNSFNLVFKWKI